MIGMGFLAWLTLAAISCTAAAIVHYGFGYRYLRGIDGFFAKWILGWIGAWIASPVLGYWFTGLAVGHQYIIPAFIGAFSFAFLTTAACAAGSRIMRGEPAESTGFKVRVTTTPEQHRAA